jgi:hypothetical protein
VQLLTRVDPGLMRLKAFRPMRVYEITLSREAQTLSMSEP